MIKYDYSGKTILVTASSQGIGYGIAKAFHDAGAKVAINARNEIELKKAHNKLSCVDPSRVFSIVGDIGECEFVKSIVPKVEDYYNNHVDILVNNSGGPPAGNTLNFTDEDWRKAIESNLLSVIRLSSMVVAGMKSKEWGRIINLTTLLAKEPAVGMVLSNVTRAGVAAYSKTISKELGEHGITVNTILTGGCLTERFYSLTRKHIENTKETMEEAVKRMENDVPVKYITTPDEFANTILFLCSKNAGYITGTCIPIDGGNSKAIF